MQLVAEDPTDKKVWTTCVDKDQLKVWKRPDAKAPINLVRLWFVIPEVPPDVLYAMLNDHAYRKVWDENMIEGKVVEMLTEVDEVGYYAAKAPSPLSDRDFCTHRTFRAFPEKKEWVIFNRSVEHPAMPVDPNYVRGHSFNTGYVMREHELGSEMHYITQSDPKGWIPKWVTNSVTSTIAPRIVEKMIDAGQKYADWKEQQK